MRTQADSKNKKLKERTGNKVEAITQEVEQKDKTIENRREKMP